MTDIEYSWVESLMQNFLNLISESSLLNNHLSSPSTYDSSMYDPSAYDSSMCTGALSTKNILL